MPLPLPAVTLIRHGQDQDNAAGIINGHRQTSLTLAGKKQAQKAALILKKESFDIFYSSPLKRARQTAQIIEKIAHFPPFQIYPLLIERNFGILTGKKEALIPQYAPYSLLSPFGQKYFWGAKDEENFSHLLQRATKIVNFLKRKFPQKKILLVTHMEIGVMIEAAWHQEKDWRQALLTFPPLKNGEIRRLPLSL